MAKRSAAMPRDAMPVPGWAGLWHAAHRSNLRILRATRTRRQPYAGPASW